MKNVKLRGARKLRNEAYKQYAAVTKVEGEQKHPKGTSSLALRAQWTFFEASEVVCGA